MGIFVLDESKVAPEATESTQQEGDQVSDAVERTDEEQSTEERMIKVDGPLSSIYTKALNEVYAKEDMAATVIQDLYDQSQSLDKDNLQHTGHVDDNGSYIYATDADKLDSQELVKAMESIRVASTKYKNCVVSIEQHGAISNRAGLLDKYCGDLGVKVCYKRSTALSSITKG
jgi:hypothetical protein